jgi:hypothetical protein
LAWIYPNQQLICLQNIPNLSTMWKCGFDISVTTTLKNDLFSVFILAWIYPNRQLICLQNIPNLSTMWKCGLDISVTTALKNDLFSVFSYWRGVIQTNNWYVCKIFLNLSTMWKCGLDISVTTALKNDLFSVFILAWIYPNQQLICLQNIPNLSTMWNVVSTYRWQLLWKMPYLVSFHIGVDLSKPTIDMFAKYS